MLLLSPMLGHAIPGLIVCHAMRNMARTLVGQIACVALDGARQRVATGEARSKSPFTLQNSYPQLEGRLQLEGNLIHTHCAITTKIQNITFKHLSPRSDRVRSGGWRGTAGGDG